MKQLTLEIQESKYDFFLKLIEHFNFVKSADEKEGKISGKQKKFIKNTIQSLHEVNLHQQGKIKLKTLEQTLDGL